MAANTTNEGEWHTINASGYQYKIPIRYQNPSHIGQGAFGIVIRATDTELGKLVTVEEPGKPVVIKKKGKPVAIKKMLDPFKTDKHAQRTYRELKLLISLNHPDVQVAQLFNVFTPERNLNDFETLYFVFNFAGITLDQLIRRGIPLSEKHIRLIIYSILRGLKFMHSAGVIHRDLKPQNIGIDLKSNVTILDFGLARVASDGIQTGYVSTRWWRAPEIYTNWERYGEKVDVWSVGCIMAELILLRTVFRGSDHLDQLNKIFDILGTPNLTTVNAICATEIRAYLNGLPPKPKQDFNQLFGFKYDTDPETPTSGVSSSGVELLDLLLSFDHRKRPTAEEALAHPFFTTLHELADEPTMEPIVDEHADVKHSIAEWKSLIWQMVQDFVPPPWINDDSDDDA